MPQLTYYYSANYMIGVSLFLRCLGLVYAIAFFSLARQVLGLYGSQGIFPLAGAGNRLYRFSLFSFWRSDLALQGFAWFGTVFGLLLFVGVNPPLLLITILIIYYSYLTIGIEFLAFQWDVLLVEVGLMAFFVSLQIPTAPLMLLAVWSFFARFLFSAGIVKLRSRDANWRNLSAVKIHYQTQPLPNLVAWHMYQLPMMFHKASAFMMFVIELAVPFLIFVPDIPQAVAFILIASLQIVLIATGNFSFLNYLTLSLCFVFLPDHYWPGFAEQFALRQISYGSALDMLLDAIGIFYILINLAHLLRFFVNIEAIRFVLSFLSHWHISKPYGLFAIMTTKRYELSIEGSADGTNWKPYKFLYKPEDPKTAPPQIAPYQPRLDWQMWFAALDPMHPPLWLRRFIKLLLKGSKPVLDLMGENPFPNDPPSWIRIVVYQYEFTNSQEYKNTKAYWRRRLIAVQSPQSLMPSANKSIWY